MEHTETTVEATTFSYYKNYLQYDTITAQQPIAQERELNKCKQQVQLH